MGADSRVPGSQGNGFGGVHGIDKGTLSRTRHNSYFIINGNPHTKQSRSYAIPVNINQITKGKGSLAAKIYFRYNEHKLDSNDRDALHELCKTLNQYSAQSYRIKVEVIGKTDHRGSNSYNFKLGQRRATSVKAYIERKLSSNKAVFDIVSLGEEEALQPGPNGTIPSLQMELERRVDVIIRKNEETISFKKGSKISIKIKDPEDREKLKNLLMENYKISRNTVDQILDILGKTYDLVSILDDLGFLAIGLSKFLVVIGFFTNALSNGYAIYKSNDTTNRDYRLLASAYRMVSWTFKDPFPSKSGIFLENVSKQNPLIIPKLKEEWVEGKKQADELIQETAKDIGKKTGKGLKICMDILRIAFIIKSDGNRQKMYKFIMKELENKLWSKSSSDVNRLRVYVRDNPYPR